MKTWERWNGKKKCCPDFKDLHIKSEKKKEELNAREHPNNKNNKYVENSKKNEYLVYVRVCVEEEKKRQ